MAREHTQPTCFVVMPITESTFRNAAPQPVDFDSVYHHIEAAVLGEGMHCIRAEFHATGRFAHASIAERLLIAEWVVADVTLLNAEVLYAIGVRDGVGLRPTVLVAAGAAATAPSSIDASRIVRYELGDDGVLTAEPGEAFEALLAPRLARRVNTGRTDQIPIVDVTGWRHSQRLEHDKTDVFLTRLALTSENGGRIHRALKYRDTESAVRDLHSLQEEMLGHHNDAPDTDSALLGVYLAYRECKAYQHMIDLFPKLPPELQASPVVREQFALAINRLAEARDKRAREIVDRHRHAPAPDARLEADQMRRSALSTLDSFGDDVATAETWAIRGRIFKGWHRSWVARGDADASSEMLGKAIDSYEQAFRLDMRDYFPGINAVTLRLTRGEPDDARVVRQLVPVVRSAVENAPPAHSEQERYWQIATKLELACGAEDWIAASQHVRSALRLEVGSWMLETTIENLAAYRPVFADQPDSAGKLEDVIKRLQRGPDQRRSS